MLLCTGKYNSISLFLFISFILIHSYASGLTIDVRTDSCYHHKYRPVLSMSVCYIQAVTAVHQLQDVNGENLAIQYLICMFMNVLLLKFGMETSLLPGLQVCNF